MLYDEAISLFDQALAGDPTLPELRTKQAYALYRLNRMERSIETLKKELEVHPNDLKALILFSFIQHNRGDPDEAGMAAQMFSDVLGKTRKELKPRKFTELLNGLFPNAGVPAYILGLQAKSKKDWPAARSCFIRAKDLAYDSLACWIQMIDLELEQKNWPSAWRMLQSRGAVSIPGENQRIPDLSPKRDALKRNENSTSQVPAEIYLLMSLIFEQQGKAAESLESMKMAYALAPFDVHVIKNMAISEVNNNNMKEAEKLLQIVIQLHPQDFQSRLLLEQLQAKRRAPGEAFKVSLTKDFLAEREVRYQYAFKQNPDDIARNINAYALSLIKHGLIIDAARWLRMFIDLYEKSPTIYYNLAQLYNTLGKNAEALKYGIKAIELKEDYRDAYDLAGNICFKIGDFDHSVNLYEAAVRLDTKDPLSYFNLGCAYNALGDFEKAEKNWLESILQENAPVTQAGDSADISEALNIIVKVEPISASACQYLGFLYAKQEKKDEALAYFKKAAEFNPRAPLPYFEIGKLYFERNEMSAAQEYFNKYLSLGGEEAKVKSILKK